MNLSKIQEKIEKSLSSLDLSLILGNSFTNLQDLEQGLFDLFQSLYEENLELILQELLNSKSVKKTLRDQANALGLGRRKYKRLVLQIGTGAQIELLSSYFELNYLASHSAEGKAGSSMIRGHLILYNWSCISKSTPRYYSFCGMLSVMCPSFDIAVQILGHLGIKGSYDNPDSYRERKLALNLGAYKSEIGISASLEKGENLSGKRVLVSYDGGRSRIREETRVVNQAGNKTFDTPWCEPHVFVIHRLNKEGEIERTCKPYYGVHLGTNEEAIEELLATLVELEIHKAEHIQFVADGARCIWRELKRKLIGIGIPNKKITLTLDYYHAVQHLYEVLRIVETNENRRFKLAKELKGKLWNGSVYSIIQRLEQLAQAKNLFQKGLQEQIDIFNREINYFKKHFDRMQYATFRRKRLVCASGIVESAIRRIINLRFKSASSFWKKENLEPLMFLSPDSYRDTFLAKRWNVFFHNVRMHIKMKVMVSHQFS